MAADDRESESEKRKAKAFERMLAGALSADARKDCPGAEILAAFYERSLGPAEAEHWRAHFAGCSRCQQALAALAASDPNPLAEEEIARLGELVAAAAAPARVGPKPRLSRWAWFFDPRTLAPLAAAVVFGVAIWVAVRSPYVAPVENQTATAPTAPVPMIAENKVAPAAPPSEASPGPRESSALQAPERRATREMPAGAPPPPPPSAPAAAAESGAAAQQAPGSTTESVTVTAEAPVPQTPVSGAGSEGGADVAKRSGAAREAGGRPAAANATPEAAGAVNENLVVVMPYEKSARSQAKAGVAGMLAAKTNSEIEWRFGSSGRIERSTDGGRTWMQQASPVQTELLTGSAPSETVCWLVGRDGAIVRTTDGVSWEVVPSPEQAEQDGQAPDWTFVEARDALYAVIRTENGRRFITSDGGKTWKLQ